MYMHNKKTSGQLSFYLDLRTSISLNHVFRKWSKKEMHA